MGKMHEPTTVTLISVVMIALVTLAESRPYYTNEEDDANGDQYYERSSSGKYSRIPLSTEATEIEDRHDYDHHPVYKYAYSVSSPQTGDFKTQHEERVGDTVRGSYSFIEADGRKRIVEYTADARHGFKALVRHEPAIAHHLHAGDDLLHDDLLAPTVHPRFPTLTPLQHTPTATSVTRIQHTSSPIPTQATAFPNSTPKLETALKPRKFFFDFPQHLLYQMPFFRTHIPSSTPTPKYYVNPLIRSNGWPFAY